MRVFIVLALAAACGGCASITRGTTDQVQINSEPPGADVRTSMGQTCTTPCTLQFGRKDEFTVTAFKRGYHSAEMAVTTRVAGGGAAAFAGNVILGGAIGMGVDAATGATLEHFPNPVELVPLRRGEPPRVIKQEPPPPPPAPATVEAQSVPQG